MSFQFIRAKPLQACKLAAIIVILLYAAGSITGILPGGLDILLLVIIFGLSLSLLIVGETVVAGLRAIRAADPVTRQFADRQVYRAVHAGEVVIAILAASAIGVTFVRVTSNPMAGPGAIGLAFIGAGLGALILWAGLIRTLTEYYYYRRIHAA